ncbi:MAG: PIN domain-containing protein [Alphaproteobacteria bacterium]|nr:PIN domain-containing protein [Alphaproteobacteria bacterium]
MIAVDTSALVAIALKERSWRRFLDLLSQEKTLIGSPTLFECYLVLRNRGISQAQSRDFCHQIVGLPKLGLVDFNPVLLGWAQFAFDRYGKGGGSGASLNYGDCMSYAVAAEFDVPLLFTGDDFRRTDLTVHPFSRAE